VGKATLAGAGKVVEVGVNSRPSTSSCPVPDSQRGEGASPLAQAWLAVVLLLAMGVYWLVKDSLIDDSYITLAYARNLAVHFHWGLIPQEIANSATSPLNVLSLAAVMAVLRIPGGVHAGLAAGVLFVACMLAVAWAWLRIGRALRLPSWVPVFGTLLVLVNPFVLSGTGLEVHLIAAAMLLLVAMAVEGRPVWFGIMGGLAVLARADLIIFVVCIALGSAAIRRQLGRTALTTIAVGAPWYLFSWIHFGSAIADTLVVKMSDHSFSGHTYVEGPLFYLRLNDLNDNHLLNSTILGTVVSFAPAAAGLLTLFVWSGLRLTRCGGAERLDPVASAALGGLVYYGAYSMLGVPPYQWYFVAPILALSIFLFVALGALARLGRRGGVAMAAFTMAVATVLASVLVDVHHGLPWSTPPIFGNWATPADYARVGTEVAERVGDAGVVAPAEIGTVAYYCNCAMLDRFSDRGRVIPVIDAQIQQAGPIAKALLRVNYLWLDRAKEPRFSQYELRWEPGPGSGPDVWQTWSPAKGIAHLTLLPAGRPTPR
jgi:hypothetical protein